MPIRDTAEVLRRTRETLATCQQGLADLVGDDPARRMTGLRNVAVFGRSVTLVLQNLRHIEDGFEEWYAHPVEAMKKDPLMRYFVRVRNEVLKEGGPTTTSSIHIEHLNTADLAPLMQNPPPGAKAFFVGDTVGGSGWEIEFPDGSTEKYYVQLPESVRIESELYFPDPPTEHEGIPLDDTSVENLARLYVQVLTSLVEEAERAFGQKS